MERLRGELELKTDRELKDVIRAQGILKGAELRTTPRATLLARLLIEDVTLRRDQDICVQIRFRGGATRGLQLPLPQSAWALRKTQPEVVAEIDRLLEYHTVREIAQLLNERGWHSSSGNAFSFQSVNHLKWRYRLKSRRQRLRQQGWLTVHELAALLHCGWSGINHWRKAGLLESTKFSDKADRFYHRPSQTVIELIQSRQRRQCRKTPSSAPSPSSAV